MAPSALPLTVTSAMPAVAVLTPLAASNALVVDSNGVAVAADTAAANK